MDGQDPVFCTARESTLSAAEGQNVVVLIRLSTMLASRQR
jgi:hypothetical protein